MKRIPTCSRCGVPTIEDDTLCLECIVDTMIRVKLLREKIARSMDDPDFKWPVTHRPLS